MARVFAVMVQILLSTGAVAVQCFKVTENCSRCRNLINGHWRSESGIKLSRSQKFVKVQDFNCMQLWVSGYNNHYEFVLGAEAKAKTVTNNLPILSVLALGII